MPAPSFSTLPAPAPDPIFAIAAKAKRAGPDGIDATIGVYMDEEGKPLLLPSVCKALELVSHDLTKRSYSYPPLLGLPTYRRCVHRLIFGSDDVSVASIATTGGTGAVEVNLRLLKRMDEDITILLPTPAWANHAPLCQSADTHMREVPYLSSDGASPEGITDALESTEGPRAILLQTGCHNPTGLDFSAEQWKQLALLLRSHDCIALLDLAYQGFSSTPQEDAFPVACMKEQGVTTLVAWSASKNHSIYSERTGLACAITQNEDEKQTVEGHYSQITRGIHSASATFGQSVVATVQEHFFDDWLKDLEHVRETLRQKRTALLEVLPARFHPALKGHGMFAQLPLEKKEITQLRQDHRVFMTEDGRINIAGIPLKRITELGKRIAAVVGW